MKLTHEEEMQAITDALAGIATAIARQIDADRFLADLNILAKAAEINGKGPSAGLLDAICHGVAARLSLIGGKRH
jgi:hypothetical protein